MSTNRLRHSSQFTCSCCGGHEAYTTRGKTKFERYVLNMVMVQPVRCCDCDALCYAFPVKPAAPILAGTQRTPLFARPA